MSDTKGPRQEWIVLAAVCGFLFFYGLGAFGLVGADEPRYAQVAREMLERNDWVTPTLGHQPWLEKPALLYWEEMIAFVGRERLGRAPTFRFLRVPDDCCDLFVPATFPARRGAGWRTDDRILRSGDWVRASGGYRHAANGESHHCSAGVVRLV
jgi:hypothetical protein